MDKIEDPREKLFQDLVNELERNYLNHPVPDSRIIAVPFLTPALQLIRILGISQLYSSEKKISAERFLMEDILSGLYSQNISVICCFMGNSTSIGVYLGVISYDIHNQKIKDKISQYTKNLISSLEGTYPGIGILPDAKQEDLNKLVRLLKKSPNLGILTGIPTQKIGSEELGVEQIERMIRALYGEEWAYIVIASPVHPDTILAVSQATIAEIREKSEMQKTTVSSGTQYGQETKEVINRAAQQYIELLEKVVARYTLGKAGGMWNVASYYCSPDPSTFVKMGILLRSIFTGEQSVPDTIRVHRCPTPLRDAVMHLNLTGIKNINTDSVPALLNPFDFQTTLSSQELATMVHLPNEEMPGYDIRKSVRYGVSIPRGLKSGTIELGMVVDRGKSTGNVLAIDKDLLTKHGLIVGITGSGKTNTCFNLLMQLWEKEKIPFLVIEPTKGEYRNLIDALKKTKMNLRIFTLGDETVAPFRMNPFEVPQGVHVQRHLDTLKAIFNASFTMVPPMPFVLEHCLINVYEKNGWNLAMNTRGTTPTLGDLYREIDVVVKGLGYHTEISMNVRAALRTRIRSLLLGGKGKMLNCDKSIPIEEILEKPTVLELKGIGDDEEKAFLMGILLGKIYEYREAQGGVPRLQHVTLVEEAHRLLSNIQMGSAEESNQAKAKAVETLCNILTEVRAYGEGILIADQVPTKLAPDAVKNTNLKIVHRIIAGDDREVIAQSMGLSDLQKDYLINLSVGRTVVFLEKLDEPFLLQIRAFPDGGTGSRTTDSIVKAHMARYYQKYANVLNQPLRNPFIGCEYCYNKCEYRFMVEPLLNNEDLQKNIDKMLENASVDLFVQRYNSSISAIIQQLGYRSVDPKAGAAIALCVLVQSFNMSNIHDPIYRDTVQLIIKEFQKKYCTKP
jgi:hypothetical protein